MRHSKGKKIALHIIMYTFVLIMMIPLLWLVVISFKTNREILTEPLQLPDVWSFQNYIDALQQLDIVKLFSNTKIISVIAVIIQLVITISSSFAISRMPYKNKKFQNALYSFFLIGLSISPFVLLFPIYRINYALGVGGKWALILPYITMGISYNTLIFSGFMKGIPRELDEAALIDGANLFQLITRIIVPVIKPAIATVVIFNLLYFWNEYPFSSIMLKDAADYTLARGIAYFKGTFNVNYAGIAAYSMMIIIPELIVYALFQKSIVEGMTAGAVKG